MQNYLDRETGVSRHSSKVSWSGPDVTPFFNQDRLGPQKVVGRAARKCHTPAVTKARDLAFSDCVVLQRQADGGWGIVVRHS